MAQGKLDNAQNNPQKKDQFEKYEGPEKQYRDKKEGDLDEIENDQADEFPSRKDHLEE